MYVGGRIQNTGELTATNVVATISNLGTNFRLAGGQPATLSVGAIAPGQSAGVYWFVGYGCVNSTATPRITVTSSLGTSATNLTITGTSTLSANATGFLDSSLLGPGAVVGQTIHVDVGYSFGGADAGYQFFLQPSGLDSFNAACFRLVSTEIRSSSMSGIPVGTRDRIYFEQTQKQSQKGSVTTRFFFEYLCEGTSTLIRPYAMATSGQQIKYTGNYDTDATTFTITFPGATNPFTITKTADRTQAPSGQPSNVLYTVTINNPSPHVARLSQFTDILPPGASFVSLHSSSDVTTANSSSVPSAGATGTLVFAGRQDVSYYIPAGGSVKLVYTARIPGTAGTYINRATGGFGSASTPQASVAYTVVAPRPLTLVKAAQTLNDPINGASNPKAIPGSRTRYGITVTNPGIHTVDANTIVLIDPPPQRLGLVLGSNAAGGGPVRFTQGSTTSGLTYTFGGFANLLDDIDFSSDGGNTWLYIPQPDANGIDTRVTHIRIRPKGAMAAQSSFSVSFDYELR
jgi:uncharacterized repeat protein (TIGR01451 family)